MKKYFLYIILISLNLYSTLVFASAATDLNQLLLAVNTMQANFTQTIFDNKNKAIQKTFGRVAIQRPDKFRWEVTKPIPQLIVANQSRLWIYDPDLEQVTIRTLKTAAGEAPTLLLSYANASLDKEYNVQAMTIKSSSLRWFSLRPKNPDNVFVAVRLGFANNVINQMDLQDHLGHTTSVQFNNVKTNLPLASSLFTFKIPKAVDVIDETKQR